MLLNVAGRADVSFTDDKGREVRGVSLWVLYNDDRVEGQKTEKLYCKQGIAEDIRPGDTVQVNFDMRGKVESISKVLDTVSNEAPALKLSKS